MDANDINISHDDIKVESESEDLCVGYFCACLTVVIVGLTQNWPVRSSLVA